MLNLNDYYLGLIIAEPSYFNNTNNQKRILQYDEADPFYDMSSVQALITGVVTLLRKKGDTYYDEDYSIYKNELAYQLGEVNSLGIMLAHVKPFIDCYHEEPMVYMQEDVLKQPELLEEMVSTHSYYIIHSKTTRSDAIVINAYEPMESVRFEYMRDALGEEAVANLWHNQFTKEKK